MTVYKAIKKEADAASQARDRAGQGRHGRRRRAGDGHGRRTPRPSSDVKSVLLDARRRSTKDNVKDVVADGFTTAAKICTTAALKTACTKNGVS